MTSISINGTAYTVTVTAAPDVFYIRHDGHFVGYAVSWANAMEQIEAELALELRIAAARAMNASQRIRLAA